MTKSSKIIDRDYLKKSLSLWRIIAIIAVFIALVNISLPSSYVGGGVVMPNTIAKIKIEGIIIEDDEIINSIYEIGGNPNIEAVIVYVNSPGGTIVGGESLYNALENLSKIKPVVTVMGGMATSGGYMAAMAAEKIYAHRGTITGSIGVILQSAEITELAKKMGVNLITFKTSELKGAPSPLEKVTPKVSKHINEVIENAGDVFVNMVANARQKNIEEIKKIADGRIFTGEQAIDVGLVDEIGDHITAALWLKESKKVSQNAVIRDVKLKKDIYGFGEFFESMGSKIFGKLYDGNGLMAVW